jgi:hypothetical protein
MDDVAVGDEDLGSQPLEIGRFDQPEVGVHHRHQRRGLDDAMGRPKPADPTCQILVKDFKAIWHLLISLQIRHK